METDVCKNEFSNQLEVIITDEKLMQWRDESLKTAEQLGYDVNLLNYIRENVQLEIIESSDLADVWYGVCDYDKKRIGVLRNNITTKPVNNIFQEVRKSGASNEVVEFSRKIVGDLGIDKFAEITNQSGMDHEIIGHMYHFLAKEPDDEKAAVETQIQMATFRGEENSDWKKIIMIMPKILGYHKSVDLLE